MRVVAFWEDGVVADLCPTEFPSFYRDAFEACSAEGSRVFLPVKSAENNYVDDQKVTLTDDHCFAEDGVLTYQPDKQSQKVLEQLIKNETGLDIDVGDSTRRIRKLKIIKSKG